jgi:MmyB-like transcription regulator ligand binding domain
VAGGKTGATGGRTAWRDACGRLPAAGGSELRLTDLIGELMARSDAFSSRWSAHDVRLHNSGTKHIRHPDVGDLEFIYEAVNLPDYPGWTMFAYTTAAGSPTEERIQLLGSLASTPSETPVSAAPEN